MLVSSLVLPNIIFLCTHSKQQTFVSSTWERRGCKGAGYSVQRHISINTTLSMTNSQVSIPFNMDDSPKQYISHSCDGCDKQKYNQSTIHRPTPVNQRVDPLLRSNPLRRRWTDGCACRLSSTSIAYAFPAPALLEGFPAAPAWGLQM